MSSNDISTCLFSGSILRGRANAEDSSLNRKDRARERDAEKFRLQKNQVFDCRRQVELQKNFGQSSSLETMSMQFDMLRQMTVKPYVSFTISTKYIDICCMYLNMFRSVCKVVIENEDLACLIASVTQIEAKV